MSILLIGFLISLASFEFGFISSESLITHPNWHLLNNDGDCGKSQRQRIIGGEDAGIGAYPWLVRLAYRQGQYIVFQCGGSIISKKYVLTANHCFPEGGGKLLFVRAGEYDARTNPDCDEDEWFCAPPVVDYRIEKIITHPNYNKGESFLFDYDITLLRIVGEFEFNDFISPICLEYGELLDEDYVGEDSEVAGWGIYDIRVQATYPVLQTVTLPVLKEEICNARLKPVTMSPRQMCAGGVIGKDSCTGDSGGPMMTARAVDGQPPRYFLIGVVSFGWQACAATNRPGVYARVSSLLTWILNNIEE